MIRLRKALTMVMADVLLTSCAGAAGPDADQVIPVDPGNASGFNGGLFEEMIAGMHIRMRVFEFHSFFLSTPVVEKGCGRRGLITVMIRFLFCRFFPARTARMSFSPESGKTEGI